MNTISIGIPMVLKLKLTWQHLETLENEFNLKGRWRNLEAQAVHLSKRKLDAGSNPDRPKHEPVGSG